MDRGPSGEDTDLEVAISEVRPDGTEVYVQSSWLRASRRELDMATSRPNQPQHTQLEIDAAPLRAGEFVEVRVEIFAFGHTFRAGSRLLVTVDAPGGARPTWAFDTTLPGGETNEIAHDSERPSKLVLIVVPGIDVPPDPAACGAPALNRVAPMCQQAAAGRIARYALGSEESS
jgi:predicted acyl esterase